MSTTRYFVSLRACYCVRELSCESTALASSKVTDHRLRDPKRNSRNTHTHKHLLVQPALAVVEFVTLYRPRRRNSLPECKTVHDSDTHWCSNFLAWLQSPANRSVGCSNAESSLVVTTRAE